MEKLIIFIPGNPSIPGVYSHFFEALNHPVIELSQIGQNQDFNISHNLIHLKASFDYHYREIKTIIQTHSNYEIILMAHSLGCSSLIYHYNELKPYIYNYIFICPFLMPFKGNEWFINLMDKPLVHQASRPLFNQLFKSRTLTNAFLKAIFKESPQISNILNHITDPKYMSNFIQLLSSYKKFYQEFNIRERLHNIPPNDLHLIFAKDDYWVPDQKRETLAHPSQHVILDMSHNFCLNSNEIQVISQYLNTVIK